MKNKFLILLLFVNVLVLGQDKFKDLTTDEVKNIIHKEFTKFITGSSTNIGNYASFGTGTNISFNTNFNTSDFRIIGISFEGTSEEGNLPLFTGSNLNTGLSFGFSYHKLFKRKKRKIKYNSEEKNYFDRVLEKKEHAKIDKEFDKQEEILLGNSLKEVLSWKIKVNKANKDVQKLKDSIEVNQSKIIKLLNELIKTPKQFITKKGEKRTPEVDSLKCIIKTLKTKQKYSIQKAKKYISLIDSIMVKIDALNSKTRPNREALKKIKENRKNKKASIRFESYKDVSLSWLSIILNISKTLLNC